MTTPTELRLAADHLDNEAALFVRQGQAALRACARIMELEDEVCSPWNIIREEMERAE